MSPIPTCPRCGCVLGVQPDQTFLCANCGDRELETQPVVWVGALESYENVRDRYVRIKALREQIERRMHTCAPGSAEGTTWYHRLVRAEHAESEARTAMLNHRDAPPQG